MAITQGICHSFKLECFKGTHNFSGDTFKMALYNASASMDLSTTAYTTTNEVSGSGYTAGGVAVAVASGFPQLNASAESGVSSGTVAIVDFDDTVFSNVSITTLGALIYNSSKSNKAVALIDFGNPITLSAATLTIQYPSPTATKAIVRQV